MLKHRDQADGLFPTEQDDLDLEADPAEFVHRLAEDAPGLNAIALTGVGGHRNLPAGGQQTLPTHGHLLTQGAGGGDTTAQPVPPSTGTLRMRPRLAGVVVMGPLAH